MGCPRTEPGWINSANTLVTDTSPASVTLSASLPTVAEANARGFNIPFGATITAADGFPIGSPTGIDSVRVTVYYNTSPVNHA